MWVLDPANSSSLIASLRPHQVSQDLEVVWVGEGWSHLVAACHAELVQVAADYRFYAIKQKWGVLEFQLQRPGEVADEITDRYAALSSETCEWCGSAGTLRDRRAIWLTLCDACDAQTADPPGPPYPSE